MRAVEYRTERSTGEVQMRTVVIGALLALICAAPLAGQEPIPPEFRYAYRDGRLEGIRDGDDIGLARVELISAKIDSDNLRPDDTSTEAHVGFFLFDRERLRLTVRYPQERYWMVPADNNRRTRLEWAAGYNRAYQVGKGSFQRCPIRINRF